MVFLLGIYFGNRNIRKEKEKFNIIKTALVDVAKKIDDKAANEA